MQEFILPFLAKHKQVSIQGIGTFYKKVDEPNWDPVAQEFNNPSYSILFENNASHTSEAFVNYIAKKQDSDPQSVIETIKGLQLQTSIEIDGVGTLSKLDNSFLFTALQEQHLQKVEAPRAMLQQAHQMVVGDNVVTNKTMQAYFEYEAPPKKWTWLHTAWCIFIATSVYIFLYYYLHS